MSDALTSPVTAFRLHQLITLNQKVTALAQYENLLFVGTSDGRVIIYHLDFVSFQNRGGPGSERLFEKHINGTKQINKIVPPFDSISLLDCIFYMFCSLLLITNVMFFHTQEVLGKLQKVLVLCDSQVSMHDMNTLDAVSKIGAKGAVGFCINQRGLTFTFEEGSFS